LKLIYAVATKAGLSEAEARGVGGVSPPQTCDGRGNHVLNQKTRRPNISHGQTRNLERSRRFLRMYACASNSHPRSRRR
jgi:hypothetical protein